MSFSWVADSASLRDKASSRVAQSGVDQILFFAALGRADGDATPDARA